MKLRAFFKKGCDITYGAAKVLSFVLPVLVMLVIFIIRGIYPFGDRSFLCTDLYHQYMPFFSEFMRAVRAGDGLSYSWNVGVGSNFLALYVYYLASPFHWLGLLVPETHIMEFLTYLVVGKLGLCGLSAFWYLSRRGRDGMDGMEGRDGMALLFSCFYALSGFMAAYNWNIMWLDCVILLPLILAGAERLVREGKCTLYCVSLSLSIFTNYYISIMICLFLVLYFVFLYCTERHPGQEGGTVWKKVWRHTKPVALFAFYSVLAAGMACVLLVPELCAILRTDFGDMSFPQETESYFSVLDMLARHCLAVPVEKGLKHWPNIYCGTAVFLLLPLYAVNERISAKKRFGMLAMAGVLLLGFSTNVLNFIWHGLNYPDSLPARQSFLYIFLMIVMCYDAFRHLDFSKEEEKKRVINVYLGVVAALLFMEKFVDREEFFLGIEWLTLLFVTVYACLLYLAYIRRSVGLRRAFRWIALAAVVAEVSVNTYSTSISTVSRADYLEGQEDYRQLYAWTKTQEDGLYRVEKFSRKTKNDGTLAGYPTASVFSSTMNSSVMDLFHRLGMRHSKVYYGYDGATAFTSALLNVKYLFGPGAEYENALFTKCRQSGEINLYRAEPTLPFGYVAPVSYDLPEGFENSGLRLQNQMVHDLGISEVLFQKYATVRQEDDVRFTAPADGIYYGMLTAGGTKKVRVEGITGGADVSGGADVPGGTDGSLEKQNYSDLKIGGVLYLGYLEEGQSVRITNNDKTDETPKVHADVYRLDEEVLQEALELLGERHLEQVEYDSTHLSGSLSLQKAGRLILSVPYEVGWQVELNGEKVEPELFGGTFMAFDLEPGDYTLSMHYVPEGKYAGMAVSAVSILCFLGIVLLKRDGREKIKKVRKSEK